MLGLRRVFEYILVTINSWSVWSLTVLRHCLTAVVNSALSTTHCVVAGLTILGLVILFLRSLGVDLGFGHEKAIKCKIVTCKVRVRVVQAIAM